jgi:hypothetical protein
LRLMLCHICSKQELWSRETAVASKRLWNNIHFWATAAKHTTEQRPLLCSRFLIGNNWTVTEERCFVCGPCGDILSVTVWINEFSAQLKVRLWTEKIMCAVVTVMFGVCNSVRLLQLFVVTTCKWSVNPVSQNPVYSHSIIWQYIWLSIVCVFFIILVGGLYRKHEWCLHISKGYVFCFTQ